MRYFKESKKDMAEKVSKYSSTVGTIMVITSFLERGGELLDGGSRFFALDGPLSTGIKCNRQKIEPPAQ